MGTKRRKKIDTTNESQEYWEKVLNDAGLSMDRGSFGEVKQQNAILVYLDSERYQEALEKEVKEGFEIEE
jgi:hypothetical protein